MRWGVAPDDSHYLPVFPFPFYNRLSDGDLADLKMFLDSLPAVSQANRPTGGRRRALAAIAVAAQPFTGPWQPDPGKNPVWNRGAYLVATVGRCGDCHTPRDLFGAPDPHRFLAGRRLAGGKKVPNITPDANAGIGKWSKDDISALLDTGQTPDGDFVGGAMGEIVRNTSRLGAADREAIATYLKTVPPVH
jgi:mono/diheme cytochrome c family protein